MPSIGWVLSDGTTIGYAEALAIARAEGAFEKFPAAALMAMRETRDDGYWLSPSSATYCPRQRVLRMTEPYHQDLEASWTTFMGSAVHASLSDAITHQGKIQPLQLGMHDERWKTMTLRFNLRDGTPYTLDMRGTPDLWDSENHAIYDYKTVNDFQYYDSTLKRRVNRVIPSPEHETQINLYGLFYRWAGIEIDHLYIWYVKNDGKKGVTRRLVEVPLWDIEFLYHAACEYAEPIAWSEHTGQLPQNRYDKDDWQCRLCPVQATCILKAKQDM